MKQEIRTTKAPLPAGPYSQGLLVGSKIYVSGQRPVNPETNEIPEDFITQARTCLNNVKAIIEEAGGSINDTVSVTVYLADIAYFAEFNAIYKEYFSAPYPTRTTVSCSLRGILVEVSAIAERACFSQNG